MEKFGVYILRCINNRYYIGSTDNLKRRLNDHRQGKVKSTRHVLPIVLAFFQPCESLTAARKLEYRLKSKKSRIIIEQIIRDGYIKFNINY